MKSMLVFFYVLSLSLVNYGWAGVEQNPKILIVLSGVNYIKTAEGVKHPTGYYLSELAGPLAALLKAGYEITYSTPNGKIPVVDATSDNVSQFSSPSEYQLAKMIVSEQSGMKYPKSLKSLTDKELKKFSGVFVPGGHAPMEDLANDPEMGRVLRFFHEHKLPTALICHGPAALLSAKDKTGTWIYAGYNVTGFSTVEEKQMEDGGYLGGHLKFYLESELRRLGGEYVSSAAWSSNAVRDRELVTAQNPMSEKQFTQEFLKLLSFSR